MPDWHYCETVHLYDENGVFVMGNIDGHPPEDPEALVPVRIHDGTDTGHVVMRSRSQIFDFDLARRVAGNKGQN